MGLFPLKKVNAEKPIHRRLFQARRNDTLCRPGHRPRGRDFRDPRGTMNHLREQLAVPAAEKAAALVRALLLARQQQK